MRSRRPAVSANPLIARKVYIAAEGGALVAVDERMVLRKAFPQSCGLGNDVGVAPRLGSEHGGLELPLVTQSVGAPVTLCLVLVNREHFVDRQIVRHFASFS